MVCTHVHCYILDIQIRGAEFLCSNPFFYFRTNLFFYSRILFLFNNRCCFRSGILLSDIINLIHDLGYSCSIDDFGSGYSSLNILKNIPVDTIKIDRGFFIGENSDTVKSDTIVRSVIDLARKLKMKTVSEGIEYKDQVDFLKEAKCDMIQGYYFSKPIPITEFEKLAFGLVISGKRTLPSESQSDFVFQPEEYLESQQDFTESNFPASVILRKKSSDEE